ncbi:MAG: HEAT repeat domain-containing protein [Fastidiosipilaceae bacterium]
MAKIDTAELRQLMELWNRDLEKRTGEFVTANQIEGMRLTPDLAIALRNSVMNSLQNWGETAFEELEGKTPRQVVESVESAEDAMDLFDQAADFCDTVLPDFITSKLGSFGVGFARSLEQRIVDHGLPGSLAEEPDDEQSKVKDERIKMAVHLLGQWQDVSFYPVLLRLFLEEENPSQDTAELIYQYSMEIGDPSLPHLIDALEQINQQKLPHSSASEYIMFMLADLGSSVPSEKIYRCLRDTFKRLERKVMGVLALEQYGDGRAVPMLRALLTNPTQKPDRQLYYETMSAIKKLGGLTDDIEDPFKDFQPKSPQPKFPQ